MPGGAREAYEAIEPIWKEIAATTEDGPCTTYIGADGAGHYVKMVHNGIEYGDMQLIAEAYDLLKKVVGLRARDLAETFHAWNEGLLQSFLIEITAKIFRKMDDESGQPLVDVILDKAGQKGTGKWTVGSALDLGVPTPTLNAAVEARLLSGLKDERVAAAKILGETTQPSFEGNREQFIASVRDALYASKICSYAQGMALLQAAAREYRWSLDLAEISRIWKGGCIIRARFLDRIREAYRRRPDLPNLLLDPEFKSWTSAALPAWRSVVQTGALFGVPLLAIGASLNYYDSYRRANLPQNLTQAQRDFFGAHTYERADKPGQGPFHTQWE
jgi:6-phosphogluconate dehydrogenase